MKDLSTIRSDFPVLTATDGDPPPVYLDSGATALKPRSVIEAVTGYYRSYSANVFRGIYRMSEKATAEYERARSGIAGFIHAASPEEVIFTRSTTESINLVAYSLAAGLLGAGDDVVTTVMEHHSNFVPWQQLAKRSGFSFRVWDIRDDGTFDMDSLSTVVTGRTKLLAISAASNVLGTITPVTEIAAAVKRINPRTLVLVDGAQSVPHFPVDVSSLGVDFLAFSGHKMMGPTGIGVLWGRRDLLAELLPFNYGGDMIREVTIAETKFAPLPHRFEAGTPHIAGVIGLGEAVRYLSGIGSDSIRSHEQRIVTYALKALDRLGGIRVAGPGDPDIRGGVIAFTMDGAHPHDVATILDEKNVCVRSGHHCAMPLHHRLGLRATTRASVYVYNNTADIDALVSGLEEARHVLKI